MNKRDAFQIPTENGKSITISFPQGITQKDAALLLQAILGPVTEYVNRESNRDVPHYNRRKWGV